MPARRISHSFVAVLACAFHAVPAAPAAAQQNVAFVTVALDPETRKADDALAHYLRSRTQLQFDAMPMEYEEAIRRVAGWKPGDQPYVARLTPYAYVAAEMLGANFEILGTYNSRATGATTYHSYFVVNRERFSHPNPDLSDLLAFVRQQPATFVYHDKFSASSFFLPSLFFRRQRVFATTEATDATEGIVPLRVVRNTGGSSGALVEQVASGEADIAAVWDGTRKKFENTPTGQRVYFIQLPEPIPNDLLVCARWLPKARADEVRAAIHAMSRTGDGQINTGDFRWWEEFKDADEARQALATLRRIAVERPAPVTVVVRSDASETESPRMDPFVEAARQAVRLSGSEFVLYDPDAYVHKDMIWTVRTIHDGAVALTVTIEGSELAPQQFQVSFTDLPDLTKRIGGLLHSRMHRIRYVWPYDAKTPTIVRDVDFEMPVGSVLEARKVTWLNPERNSFREGDLFHTSVKAADFFKFSLDDARFPHASDTNELANDPMSNVAYRVVLVRPASEPFLIGMLTSLFVVLLVSAGVASFIDLRRGAAPLVKRRRARPVVVSAPATLLAMEQTH
jgi:ABC-type phosphate/phosphonate transport system substrate-binding protein